MKVLGLICTLAVPRMLAAEPRVTAPVATTPASLPTGLTLDPLVKLPTTPPFKPRAPSWWKAKQPCPAGSKLKIESIGSTLRAFVCRDRDGKQHGPGVAVFTNGQPYEDAWSVHGENHGTRWTWHPDGKLDHVETFVNGKLQGSAEEWSGETQIAAGAYLDGKRHGAWTYQYPNQIVMRGYHDHGRDVGTWIGTRAGVTVIHGEMGTGSGDRTWRVFDAAGHLTLERVMHDTSITATGWSTSGARLAEYDCDPSFNLVAARFFDDRNTLARRWSEATSTLTDARGTTIPLTAEQKFQMSGARSACGGSLWMLEGPPPSRDIAFGRAPK